jgi:hypothetical protein
MSFYAGLSGKKEIVLKYFVSKQVTTFANIKCQLLQLNSKHLLWQRRKFSLEFYVHWSAHRESMSIIVQQDVTMYSLLHFCKLLYMFWVATPPIIRSTYNCNYSIWRWSNRLCYLPLWWSSWNCVLTAPP